MTDALIMGGILLALVLLTQVGRHRHNLILGILPFVSCGVIAALYFGGGVTVSTPNITAGLVGTAIGVAFGGGLIATMRVGWNPETGRVETRAGVPYLLVWLVALVGRIVFVWALEHVHTFARHVGEFMARHHLTEDGVGLFFVLMALTMVALRAAAVLWQSRRLHRTPQLATS